MEKSDDTKQLNKHAAQVILDSINQEDKIEDLKKTILLLNTQLNIALKALNYIARPWPQKELANVNFDVAKQALKDISEV